MRAQIALALRLALLALSVAAAAPPLQRDELYVLPLSPYGSDTALLAPALSLGGGTSLAVGPASEPQACALACQANPACSWFNFRPCSEQVGGCFGSGTSREGEGAGFARGKASTLSMPSLEPQGCTGGECEQRAGNCTLSPPVSERGGTATAGAPLGR